jgi:hypothetical protein
MPSKLRFESQAEPGNEEDRHNVVFFFTFSPFPLFPRYNWGLEVET